MTTTWAPCSACGATTRHDDGVCIRDPRHPRFDDRIAPALHGSTATVAPRHLPRDMAHLASAAAMMGDLPIGSYDHGHDDAASAS